jgi:GAF domain-containing protein
MLALPCGSTHGPHFENAAGSRQEARLMGFDSKLAQSLDDLDERIASEDYAGHSLETALEKYLLEIEAASDSDIRTSILLLDRERNCLLHGAAPSLPKVYCDAIDGLPIGPSAGSCGTAAFVGHSIFATDVAADPLWQDYRDLALPHQLRSCWSTPIRSDDGAIIGTFAIYHSTARAPTEDEILAVKGLSGHVARAIARWSGCEAV